ncbi:MAG: cyclic-phosphate processing receiver domain-containing protein [Planctomycetota bacterium]
MHLLILEDDHERIRRFGALLKGDDTMTVARTAPSFIEAYRLLTNAPDLICLDHDLFIDLPSDPDPGDGRDVSNFLVTQESICPALIHSTNADAADSMLFSMRDAGWRVERIAPLGDDWIEAYWFPTVLAILSSGQR